MVIANLSANTSKAAVFSGYILFGVGLGQTRLRRNFYTAIVEPLGVTVVFDNAHQQISGFGFDRAHGR